MNEMEITSAQYCEALVPGSNPSIRVTIDGQDFFVPVDPNNRHYVKIMRRVKDGTLRIADPVKPAQIDTPTLDDEILDDKKKEPFASSDMSKGSIVQVVHNTGDTITIKTTLEYTIMTVDVTTLRDGSRLHVSGIVPRYQDNSDKKLWSGAAYVFLKKNGVAVASYEHVGSSDNAGQSSTVVPFEYYTEPLPAGVNINFAVSHKSMNKSLCAWSFGRSMFGVQILPRITVMEIAQ